jgi:hypothetical protein
MAFHFGLDRERLDALDTLELLVAVYANVVVLKAVKTWQGALLPAAHVILAFLNGTVIRAVTILCYLLLLAHRSRHQQIVYFSLFNFERK